VRGGSESRSRSRSPSDLDYTDLYGPKVSLEYTFVNPGSTSGIAEPGQFADAEAAGMAKSGDGIPRNQSQLSDIRSSIASNFAPDSIFAADSIGLSLQSGGPVSVSALVPSGIASFAHASASASAYPASPTAPASIASASAASASAASGIASASASAAPTFFNVIKGVDVGKGVDPTDPFGFSDIRPVSSTSMSLGMSMSVGDTRRDSRSTVAPSLGMLSNRNSFATVEIAAQHPHPSGPRTPGARGPGSRGPFKIPPKPSETSETPPKNPLHRRANSQY